MDGPVDFVRLVRDEVHRVVHQSTVHSFSREAYIQGYMLASFQDHLPKGYQCVPEANTSVRYVRDRGLLRPSRAGRPGQIDLVIRKDGADHVGIELEYPRGTGRELESLFEAHLRNDVTKLENESPIREGYVLIFSYRDPPFHPEQYMSALEHELQKTKLAYLRFAKAEENRTTKPLLHSSEIPKGWLGLHRPDESPGP